jgi:hypothetical protein
MHSTPGDTTDIPILSKKLDFSIGFLIKTNSCAGGHLKFPIHMKNANSVWYHPMTIHALFGVRNDYRYKT